MVRRSWIFGLPIVAGCVISRPIARAEEEPPAGGPVAESAAPPPAPPAPAREEAGAETGLEIGRSVQDRPILLRTFGSGPRRVVWIGGIHGDEQEGHLAADRLPDDFSAHPGAAGEVTLYLVPDANPDGAALGRRGNANGVDLNRNFPSANFDRDNARFGREPLSQPEARALHDLILRVEPELVIVSHAWRGDHFINFDGPAEPLAYLFSVLSGYRVRRSDDISPTPGSLGSWVGVDLGIPILTVEHERGIDPELAWRRTRVALLGVILGT